jgi:hypothetical protein
MPVFNGAKVGKIAQGIAECSYFTPIVHMFRPIFFKFDA